MTDDLGSWEVQIDVCLGQARRVLDAVTGAFVGNDFSEERVAGAIALAEAWRLLAEAWEERQAHELQLVAGEAELEDAEVEPVEAQS